VITAPLPHLNKSLAKFSKDGDINLHEIELLNMNVLKLVVDYMF